MLCPVCNGMILLETSCPNCGARAEDEGRPEDWTGPYAPYELTPRAVSGMESEDSLCPHLAQCPACGLEFLIRVEVWHH